MHFRVNCVEERGKFRLKTCKKSENVFFFVVRMYYNYTEGNDPPSIAIRSRAELRAFF